ncbi:glycosyltransferase [Psychroserpens sp. XS_ASV72]|uniref:glycosyltransferase n=1 Tax=Psychroserpens sp. XS_ASV72 TaxID=3241293 RepID=UPI0035159207
MDKKLLIIGFVWPEPNSSAAGSRMMQLIALFQQEDYDITFASACAKTENATNLKALKIATETIALNHSSFDDFVKDLQPDVVIFDRFMTEEQFGWRVAEHCPNALRILDTEDLHCLRKGREEAFKCNDLFETKHLFNDVAKREIASILRSDLSLIISEAEMDILTQVFKIDHSLLYYLPFLLDAISEDTISTLPKFDERHHFITIGNFLHPPNYQSVLYLKQYVWPKIRQQLPKAELHVYGAYTSQKVNQLHQDKEGFFIKGYAEDVAKVMQKARVCLAPLQFGAGLKGKLVDAMQNGTPCVMSSIAAEGMFGPLDTNGFIVDDIKEFVTSAVDLYTNASIWKAFQDNGFKVINSRFQRTNFQDDFMQLIQDLRSILDLHRQGNFMGQLLQHHSLQSTKYMSKWIEEKNKS